MSTKHHLPVAVVLVLALTDMCRLLPAQEVRSANDFVSKFCIECHSRDEPNGEREFESLNLADDGIESQLRIQEIIDQLTLQNMPPEEADQPAKTQRLKAIAQLTEILAKHRRNSKSTGGQTVLRRMNRREYRNTVSDLLGVDMTMFDPTQEFPDDNLSENFDTIGNSLSTSGFLLEKYLKAADLCVEKVFAMDNLPKPKTWVFKDYFYQQPELRTAHHKAFKHRYLILYDHPNNDKPEGAFGPIHDLKNGVPADGVYEIRIRAHALHRDTPYGPRTAILDTSEPFRMGIRAGDTRIGDLVHTQPIQPLLAEAVIRDNDLEWYTFRVPLDKGFTPRFTFENGQHDVRGAYGRVFRNHRDTLPKEVRNSKGIVEQRNAVVKVGQLPQIRIHEIQIHGPLPDSPHAKMRNKVIGEDKFNPNKISGYIQRFVSRAFRRPATKTELERFESFYRARVSRDKEPLVAFKDTLKAVLCSAEFLYLSPPNQANKDELDDYALAERLSYFLTSSMPDEQLRLMASRNGLADARILEAEVIRLLKKNSSQRFVEDFLDSWLNLRALGSMPPDVQQFRVYYASSLEAEMKKETQLYFRHLIDENLSASHLIDSDFSFVNRDLAKIYNVEDQVPVKRAGDFQRVKFDDRKRGGLLGQASVLTVSANGIETSPVTRGVWILENILGTSPPPPPDDVPAIEPDVRGAVTIRDRLNKHRASATCNQCHRKIDPLGFALEGFDPIGRSRNFYDLKRRTKVDTSGVLPGGQKFKGVADLKKLLLERKEFFVRTLTTRLLTHALGRHIETSDRGQVDQILDKVKANDYRLKDLMIAIVQSDLFKQR